MSRTTRTRYDGTTIRDGEHGRRCPSGHCAYCGAGRVRDLRPTPLSRLDLQERMLAWRAAHRRYAKQRARRGLT